MLFDKTNAGAEFSECRKYRYALWRIWDDSKPLVMFIGLNPSTANESDNDPTIKSVCRIAKANGYGGVYMMNCFPFISTDPTRLIKTPHELSVNANKLYSVGKICHDVVFAWGNFNQVGSDVIEFMVHLFPSAKALHINANGSPKHPLYCKSDTKFIPFNKIKPRGK